MYLSGLAGHQTLRIPSSKTALVTKGLSTATSCRTAAICLLLKISQKYNTNNGRHFYSTCSLVYTTHVLAHISIGSLLLLYSFTRYLHPTFPPTKSTLTSTTLSNGTLWMMPVHTQTVHHFSVCITIQLFVTTTCRDLISVCTFIRNIVLFQPKN